MWKGGLGEWFCVGFGEHECMTTAAPLVRAKYILPGTCVCSKHDQGALKPWAAGMSATRHSALTRYPEHDMRTS